jgi:hypothetical protein
MSDDNKNKSGWKDVGNSQKSERPSDGGRGAEETRSHGNAPPPNQNNDRRK